MALNEKTSEPVASKAAKILQMENPRIITDDFWKDIQSVAGSALTQAPDKPQLTAGQQRYAQIFKQYEARKNQKSGASIYKAMKNAQSS